MCIQTKATYKDGRQNMEKSNNSQRKLAVGMLLLSIPVVKAIHTYIRTSRGNRATYSLENTDVLPKNSLYGKTIIFLGSSVTYGSASGGISFVDYMQKRDGIRPIKEAVSGTTLVDEDLMGKKSYIARMKTIDKNIKADAFVCQLSTNDATVKKPLGSISSSFRSEDFDTKTILGAIEYVIAYARQTWNCPILFYTGTKYKSKFYEQMVNALLEIKKKWNIEVLDLWHDEEMNQVSKHDYNLYMANAIHPSKAGYREWWTPKFEEKLKEICG